MIARLLAGALGAMAAALAIAGAGPAAATDLAGAGATFPAPLYATWARDYAAANNTRVNYQAIGSGGGLTQIRARTVDFGASDRPLTPAELAAAHLYQFPTIVGGVVPIVNLPGLGSARLRLTGAVLAEIYLGRIRRWNAPALAALNPHVGLPALPITVVHRADGSGTSFIFTSFLALAHLGWARQVGAGDAVQWPLGLGGRGNDGVTAFVRQTAGAIGYVEFSFARRGGVATALVRNRAGAWPEPGAPAFAAASAGADWLHAPGNRVILLDRPGAAAWPISASTFVLVPRDQADAARGTAVLRFFAWAFAHGDAAAARLDYVPLPARVKLLLQRQWARRLRSGTMPLWSAR